MKIEILNSGRDLKVVDDDGTCYVIISGPMMYAAAAAFIKYHNESGLIGFAMDHLKNKDGR